MNEKSSAQARRLNAGDPAHETAASDSPARSTQNLDLSNRHGRYIAALGGLLAALAPALLWGAWWYASPLRPDLARQERALAPQRDYQPGGASCAPGSLSALPPSQGPVERDRCADALEKHRVQRGALAQQVRANDIAEWTLRVAAQQARSGFVQTLATVAAFLAAALAALFAWSATVWTRASAKTAAEALDSARAGAVAQDEAFKQQLRAAKDSVDAAREATIAADRAWLSVSAEVGGPLVFEGDDVHVEISCVARNLGRSPAIKVIWDRGLFGSAGAAHQKIADNTRFRSLGSVSHGRVLLPSDEIRQDFELTMKRSEFIECCREMAEIEPVSEARTFPSIIVGVQYALPGERTRRFTYMSYYILRVGDDPMDFDGSESKFDPSEISLLDDGMAGPIT